MQRSRYQSLTLKQKLEIINLMDNAPSGKKKKDIATEVGIPASTLSAILKNRDTLQTSYTFGSSKKSVNETLHVLMYRCSIISVVYSYFVHNPDNSKFLFFQIFPDSLEIRIKWTALYLFQLLNYMPQRLGVVIKAKDAHTYY